VDSLYLAILVSVVFILNMYSFLLFRSDKIRATTQEWRISEKKLLAVSFFGPFGAYAGMKKYRHKTQKLKFKLVGVFIFIQVLLIALIIFNYFWPEVLDPYIPLSF
jgi:uncharacterized membrane protein YsdA (DUF1294 family)